MKLRNFKVCHRDLGSALGILGLMAVLWPGFVVPAQAHVGHGGHAGETGALGALGMGLLHPWSGLDHLLAMVAVGLWAAQLGGRALWLVPGCFVVAMAGASFVSLPEAMMPVVESGIAATVLLLGLAVAAAVRVPVVVPAVLVGLFAVAHGIAHGAEMPGGVSRLAAVAGFSVSTAVLHGLGLGLGLALLSRAPGWLLRVAGAVVAMAGMLLLGGRVLG